MKTRAATATVLGVIVGAMLAAPAMAQHEAKLTEDEAVAIGTDAYVYGYPLVTVEMTRRVTTNVVEPKGLRAPMGQFANARTYPNASFTDVTAPNADTLYSSAWLDVAKEPYVLSLPDEGDRYFLIPMLDAWTNVFEVPGKRTTGDKAQKYAITGPGWTGKLPEGVTEYKSPTGTVWIIGRTYCTGTPDDYKAVHALQDNYSLVPLRAYGQPYTPPKGKVDPAIDMKTPVREQVEKLDAGAYFKLMAALMKDNRRRGRADGQRQDGEDRPGPGSGLRHRQARPGGGQGPARRSQGRGRKDHGQLQERGHERQRLADHAEGGNLRHGIPPAGFRHRYRPRRQSPPGCNLSDIRSRR
jgi:hypothetical protein